MTLVFVCIAVLAYTYVGYPLLLGFLARRFGREPARDPGWEPTVTVCIAAFDVAAYIEAKLESVAAQTYPADRVEILVYSDGSRDGTDDVVRAFAARDPRVRLIVGPGRRGKPSALNEMRRQATGDVIFITDARQPLASGALRALLALLADPNVGCVTGNLVLEGQAGSGVYWRYENWLRRMESRFRSVVGMTGPIAALRRQDLDELPADIILDDVWIPMRLRLRGKRVLLAEDAIAYDRAFGDEREFRRKVRTLAGNYQVFARLPAMLSPLANPSWFETISHKIMRLLCPWALLGLLFASARGAFGGLGLPANPTVLWMFRVLFAAQAAVYLAAIAGPAAGRLAGVARTFVVLNVAAVVGLWRWATGKQRITW